MLIYDPALLPLRPREEPGDAAVRIARRVIELMQARDADGYVFRLDLRLRHHPAATPIALPLAAVFSYYESAALPWERAAFIRSRPAPGGSWRGPGFFDATQPFACRRPRAVVTLGDI